MKNTIKVLFWAVICAFAWSPVSATMPSTGQPATLSPNSADAEILSIQFTYSDCGCDLGTFIDPYLGRVFVKVPFSLSIANLAPSVFLVSPGATISPDPSLAQNWTLGAVEYTVTASDGITQRTWSVKVENLPCNLTGISSWFFNNNAANGWNYDTANARISIRLVPGTDLTTLSATVGLDCGATIQTLAGGAFPTILDFSAANPQQFQVVAQNGDIRIWTIIVYFQDIIPPAVTTWNVSVSNCTNSVAVQMTEPGNVLIVHESAINMSAVPNPLPLYNLGDWSQNGTANTYMLVSNRLGAYTYAPVPNTPANINTFGLYPGTYWAFAVDNSGNVSPISAVSLTITQCEVVVSSLTELVGMPPVWKIRVNRESFVTYEESRAGGNIKYAQDANTGILIKDINSVLNSTYGEGAGLTNLVGTLDYSGLSTVFIPCCSAPLITSTNNVIVPKDLTYDEFRRDCYLNTGPRMYASMLVRIITPMIVRDDYSPSHPNWMFDNLDLNTISAAGGSEYFIQSIFNSPLIGTAIPTVPAIYTGIRANVNWGVGMTYGLITPRKTEDIQLANMPGIKVTPNPPEINDVLPGMCKTLTVKILNEGVGNLTITGLSLSGGTGSADFSLGIPAPVTVPFTIGTWASQDITISYCPSEWGSKTTNLVVEYGSGQTLVILVKGSGPLVFEMPYLQEFKYSAGPPVLWESGETLNNYTGITGWSNPTAATAVGGVMVGYYSNWVTPYGGFVNNNKSIYMRPRVGSATVPYTRPVTLLTPGFQVTGTDPVVSWVEHAWWALSNNAFHAVGSAPDPRILSISEDGVDWTSIRTVRADAMSYTTADPASYSNPTYDQVVVSLKDYIGKTVFFRFDLTLTSGKYVYWIIDNFELKERVTTPLFSYTGDGNFGNVLANKSSQKIIGILNTGVSLLRIQSAEIIGDPEFTVSSGYSFPVDVKGSGSGWSENPMVTLLNLTVNFNPLAGSDFSAVLRIKYGISEEKVIDIPLTGVGISCSNAIPITSLNCSEGPPAECKKSILGPQESIYKYTALYEQDVTITSCDPHNNLDFPGQYAWDTWLKVYSACFSDPGSVLLADNDDQGANCGYNQTASAGTFHMTTNQTVYIYWPLVFPDAAHAYDDFVFTITVTPTPPWPNAEFYADQTVIEAGESVNFTSNSTGSPTTWAWEFPGSTQGSSTIENPTGITYPNAGNYQVILTASNTNFSGNMTKIAYIIVGTAAAEPVAGGAEGFTVGGFKSASVTDGSWTFGDNNGLNMNWQIRSTGVVGCAVNEPYMPSTTGYSGYLVMPAVEYNCGATPPNNVDVDAFAQSPSFDCSAYDVVIYQFQQRFNANGQMPRMELQVSNDGGYNWKAFDVLQGRSLNTTWGSPVETAQINITESAGRQADVRVRFYWKGSTGDFWMVDDVEVLGIKACEGLTVSIEKDESHHHDERSYTLEPKVKGGLKPYTYLWSTGETSQNITVSPWRTTEYQLEVTDVQGCTTSSTITVIGRACEDFSVSISGDDKIYLGYAPKSSTTLKSKIREGRSPFTYLWSTGAATANISVSPSVTTRYELVVTDSWGCRAVAKFTVTVEDIRCGTNLDQVLVCKQERNRKSVTVCVPSSQVASLLRSGASLGPCRKSGLADDGVVSEMVEPEMLVFPNPNNGRVNLELKGLNGERVSIEVRDVLGRVVYREEVDAPEELFLKSINLDRSGIYFISVKNSSVNLTRQVSVIR